MAHDKPDIFALAQHRYTEYLKQKKMFLTRERTALLEFIFHQEGRFSADGHFSADELLYEMQRTGGHKVSRATLYRTLSQLVEAGVLSESDFGHGHTHYEIDMDDDPHIHLVSLENRGEVREVTSEKIITAFAEVLRKEGFVPKRYNLQIFGNFIGKPKS